ncbi:hypothetical protein JCM4814A_63760 [Streptomyces phaeofaciens JCM 4814]|uniref:DUF2330 domain-containing protein n=1 Tax=Streptomyces phaeofaciens TaxID=68254 RepID=A0A918HMU3_9ACTN|nr:DUF2330 domain-containing protein [Streptomyces phaeofaciens]GGT77112.1 hypothetical protein GCM10010226_64180 [Streptomyces phaeofaciens]
MLGSVGTVGFLRGCWNRLRPKELRARVGAVLIALLVIQLGSLVAPAYACGCGALVSGDQRPVTVGREVSVVRWDGEQEQIVMRLTVGGSAGQAAWIMPVPNRATVRLGDAGLFDQLAETTAPVQRTRHHFWPQDGDWPLTTGGDGGPPPPPPGARAGSGVDVVGREKLGPFDVARLAATDPAALRDWLTAHDFTFPGRLENALQPYVDRRWEYVAVRLAPAADGVPLTGELEPLHLTFASDRLVYPMRLSRLAHTPQSLGLYVLAAHRMEPASRIGGERPRVTFAGRLGSTTGPLRALAAGTPFLTAVAQEFPVPSAISDDHELRRAPEDTAFRQVIYEDRLVTVVGVPVWLLTVGGGLTALATAAIVVAVRREREGRGTVRARHAHAWRARRDQGKDIGIGIGIGIDAGIGDRAGYAYGYGAVGDGAAPSMPSTPPKPSAPPPPPATPPVPAKPPIPPAPATPPAPPRPATPPAPPRPATPPAPPAPPGPTAPPPLTGSRIPSSERVNSPTGNR